MKEKVPSDGTLCERCGEVATVKQTVAPTPNQLKKAFYYTRVYVCRNADCKRQVFFKEEHRVWNRNASAQNLKMLQEERENLQRMRSLF